MNDHYFSDFGRPPSDPDDLCTPPPSTLMIYAKIQPQGIHGSGGEDF